MPHCIIEYTRDLEKTVDIKNLVDVAFESIYQSGLFKRTVIKARAYPVDYYKSGLEGDDHIHLTVKILPGRTDEQKKALTDIIIENLEPIVGNVKSTSVEVVDLHGPSYNKILSED